VLVHVEKCVLVSLSLKYSLAGRDEKNACLSLFLECSFVERDEKCVLVT
jgi:hypothetical protein